MSLMHFNMGGEYALSLSAWGEGRLEDSGMSIKLDDIFREYRESYGGEPPDISLFIEDTFSYGLDYGYTSIDPAYLERLETLRELILPDSVTELEMTPKLEEIFKKNDPLIRGSFDSFAERFAAGRGLRFRPADFVIGRYEYEPVHEVTVLTMVFHRDGSIQVKTEVSSPGSSAGNTFGGTFWRDLDRFFYRTETFEQVAAKLPSCDGDVVSRGKLAEFMEKAKTHKICMGKN